ncbi:MAG: 50S ribosomal protein L10 [Simkaniaceae bacterium]|nr:50S ribosomal protein L10 [Simkaniaceae bacterium]
MRPEKQLLRDVIVSDIENCNAFVLVSYQNIDPNVTADLRMELVKSGGDLAVVKKRIFLKAAKDKGIEFTHDQLEGHLGIVYAEGDAIDTTKAICKFSKNNDKFVKILAGYFDNKICSPDDVIEISKLPSTDQMRAELLATFEAPLVQTVSTINEIITSVVNCIKNKCEKEVAK